jgi:hypothetical protein
VGINTDNADSVGINTDNGVQVQLIRSTIQNGSL